MKGKDRENLKGLTVPEMAAALKQTKEKYFQLCFKRRVAPPKNPLEVRELRRHIARLETWIRGKTKTT